MHNNPLIDATLLNPDVVVHYDPEGKRFIVTFIATNSGYSVKRESLISENFKFTNRIEDEILSGCETDDELDVIFTQRAANEVHLIWMANCDIF